MLLLSTLGESVQICLIHEYENNENYFTPKEPSRNIFGYALVLEIWKTSERVGFVNFRLTIKF